MKLKLRAATDAIVDFAGNRPWTVLVAALATMLACWTYAQKLDVRSDILELLPRESPGFQAFERRVKRAGGRATLFIVCESPDRNANERFVDTVRTQLDALAVHRPDLISFIESGTKDVRRFFEEKKWLYADLEDLERADATLDQQIAIRSGIVEDLLDTPAQEPSLGMSGYKARWQKAIDEKDDFPSGYFLSKDGTRAVVRVIGTGAGMGAATDDELLHEADTIVRNIAPTTLHPAMKVGFGGDIAQAAAEKASLVHEALIATALAAALILGGVVWFYRSLWSIVLMGFPPLFGVGCAYAFATARYGYVNSSGAFLGAIILGNGVNYPLVLYSRYKEFRARGMLPPEARREAVANAFRAELAGAAVASIAYGSLTVTQFRGFSQFGVIGFVGMLLVWISMIPCVPALLVLIERIDPFLPRFLRDRAEVLPEDESRGPVARFVANLTARHPRWVVAIPLFVTGLACFALPSFLRDPWEYDFDKLGSKGSRSSGPAQWSAKADEVLTGRMNLAGSLIITDKPEQAGEVKERLLAKDAASPKGRIIESITTIDDFLPKDQDKKVEVLDRMRDRLTPAVLARLAPEERQDIEEMTPPEGLKPIGPKDLPLTLRRRFQEVSGTLGTLLFVRYRDHISTNDGHDLLQMASLIEGLTLGDGTKVDMASRATVFAEMIRSLERDGPLATAVSFFAVVLVVLVATSSWRGSFGVIASLILGVLWLVCIASLTGERLNFLNFIALPITFGIGSEYPFNIFDRSRLLGGDVTRAVKLSLGTVALCSYTTIVGYGSLIFADNQALQSFGRLAMAGEFACITSALLFLPALLHLMGTRVPAVVQPIPHASESMSPARKSAPPPRQFDSDSMAS